MNKKLAMMVIGVLLTASFTACGAQAQPAAPAATEAKPAATESTATETVAEEEATEAAAVEEQTGAQEEVYASEMGWVVRYDPSVIQVESIGEPETEVDFIYTGECAGACMLSIKFDQDHLPDAVIDDIKKQYDEVEVTGSFFPGTTDKWGYWVGPKMEEGGDAFSEEFIVGEYSNGTLIFDFSIHKAGDDEIDIPVSDALALVIDSIEYENFGPQTMYDGIPGEYKHETTEEIEGEDITSEDKLILNEDHHGVMSFQDDVNIVWDDRMIMGEDGSFAYTYTKDGDKITLDYDGNGMEFVK